MHTIVVTGATSGIGLAAAEEFARRGDRVVLVGRDPHRLRDAADRVRQVAGRPPETQRADFAVLDDVRALADRLRTGHDTIDVLANNAGGVMLKPVTTADGFELTMQTNHLAPFLLSALLVDRLRRVVSTASAAHRSGALDPDQLSGPPARYRAMRAYGSSKQANILFTREAARRWGPLGVLPTCVFPGLIQSRFGRTSALFSAAKLVPVLFQPPERGADTLVWLATDDDTPRAGEYYAFRRPFVASPRSVDDDRARRLWMASLAAVGLTDAPAERADG